MHETRVIMSVACLPAYAPQDIRDHQLVDSLVGPLVKAKEADEKSQSVKARVAKHYLLLVKGCIIVQLWDQLFVKDNIMGPFPQIVNANCYMLVHGTRLFYQTA